MMLNKTIPELKLMPRVNRDIKRLLAFIKKQPYGNPRACKADIEYGFKMIRYGPELNDVGAWRVVPPLELRRHNVAQFAIIYAYLKPNQDFPNGVVSIRAVRHSRVRNVFLGVRETTHNPYNAFAS